MRDASRFALGGVLATGTRYYVRNLLLILPISLLAFTPAFLVIAVTVNDALRFDLGPVRGDLRTLKEGAASDVTARAFE